MPPLRKVTIAVLLAASGALSAGALSACSDDDIFGGDSDDQVEVSLMEYDIDPGPVRVSAGDVEFAIKNDGERVHELAITTQDGTERSGEIDPGDTKNMTVDLAPGRYRMYDPRSDYRARGMRSTIIVSDDDSDAATVTERTVERTVVEEPAEPEVQEPEVQEPEVQPPAAPPPPPPPPPPPARTVTQVIPAEPPPPPPATTTP